MVSTFLTVLGLHYECLRLVYGVVLLCCDTRWRSEVV